MNQIVDPQSSASAATAIENPLANVGANFDELLVGFNNPQFLNPLETGSGLTTPSFAFEAPLNDLTNFLPSVQIPLTEMDASEIASLTLSALSGTWETLEVLDLSDPNALQNVKSALAQIFSSAMANFDDLDPEIGLWNSVVLGLVDTASLMVSIGMSDPTMATELVTEFGSLLQQSMVSLEQYSGPADELAALHPHIFFSLVDFFGFAQHSATENGIEVSSLREAEQTANTDPTDPLGEPTEPIVDPSELTTDPTDPFVDPADPFADPSELTPDPTNPFADPADPFADPSELTSDPTDPFADPADPFADPFELTPDPTDPFADPTQTSLDDSPFDQETLDQLGLTEDALGVSEDNTGQTTTTDSDGLSPTADAADVAASESNQAALEARFLALYERLMEKQVSFKESLEPFKTDNQNAGKG